jgi:hypothetical protein
MHMIHRIKSPVLQQAAFNLIDRIDHTVWGIDLVRVVGYTYKGLRTRLAGCRPRSGHPMGPYPCNSVSGRGGRKVTELPQDDPLHGARRYARVALAATAGVYTCTLQSALCLAQSPPPI